MLSEALRERLSSLRRGEVGAAEARGSGRGRRASASPSLRDCFPEGAVRRSEHGEVFVCQVPLRDIHSEASRLREGYLRAFRRAGREVDGKARSPHLGLLEGARPASTALIDTETAGFHGRPLFLIGLMRWQEDDLVLSQYFARDYAQEAAVLGQLAEGLPELDLLVSFNGKAFDWPLVRERMSYHRLACRASFAHLDLLHPSRRRWRSQLPNCKLQTLERYLCGRWRSGDIPSQEIPQRYHDFVREQDARLIAPVFHHNRLDLITMVELLVALAEGEHAIA